MQKFPYNKIAIVLFTLGAGYLLGYLSVPEEIPELEAHVEACAVLLRTINGGE